MVKKHFSSGLNFIPAFILLSFSLFFTSCTKEEFVEPSITSENPSSELRVTNQVLPELFGFYTQPTYLVIGDAVSENKFLDYLKKKGGNMINGYVRNSMKSSSERSKFAA